MAKTFNEVLAAAVNDIVEHGYDSQARVDHWMEALEQAAKDSLINPVTLEQKLTEALAAIYRKQVENGKLEVRHQGIERFTIDRVKPKLRAELDRRIMASADLIKLNRQEAISKTLRRFQGWSTSIPIGGTAEPERAKTKKDVRRALAQLPFEERRVLIDQGHKLNASLSNILATDGGAIACIWHSHWRQAGYDYREDHKERDEEVYLLRPTWATEQGLVKQGKAGYYDKVTAVGEEVFCRCYLTYLYALSDLPKDMLTKAGRDALSRSRVQ